MGNFLKNLWIIITSRKVWINLIIAIAVFIILVLGLFQYLKFYTMHGESITVPPMLGMTLTEAQDFVKDKDLQLQVTDSIYNPDLKPEQIINQVPKAGSKVKEGRTIYLTIRSKIPEKGVVPDVESLSLRNAISKLQNAGFVPGEKKYKAYKYPNTVIYLSINDVKVPAGAKYPKGTKIDLVVGNGLGKTKVVVPNLKGMTRPEAETLLFGGYALNIGNVFYNDSTMSSQDSANAVVYKQNPEAGTERRVGEFVDIYLMQKEKYDLLIDTMPLGTDSTGSILKNDSTNSKL